MFTHGLLPCRAAWMRRLAMSLTLALGFLPIAGLMPAAQAQGTLPAPAPVKSILLFPSSASADAGANAAALTTQLDDAIKLRLALVGTYSVTSYTKFLPSIQRALLESGSGGLTDADVTPPFDQARGQKIAALVGTDTYLLNTITSYTQDPTSRRVTIVVGSRVYNSQTGNPVPGLGGGYSGSAGPTSANDTDADIQQGAINDVAARIAAALNAAAPAPAPIVRNTSRRGSSSRTGQNILAGILIVALATAIISGSHFGGGGGGGNSSSSSSTSTSSGSSGGTTSPPPPPSLSGG